MRLAMSFLFACCTYHVNSPLNLVPLYGVPRYRALRVLCGESPVATCITFKPDASTPLRSAQHDKRRRPSAFPSKDRRIFDIGGYNWVREDCRADRWSARNDIVRRPRPGGQASSLAPPAWPRAFSRLRFGRDNRKANFGSEKADGCDSAICALSHPSGLLRS